MTKNTQTHEHTEYGCSHTHTHSSSQHTWKLRPLLLPHPSSVWRRQSLLLWECFCFPLFWSADLILSRMLRVAGRSPSIFLSASFLVQRASPSPRGPCEWLCERLCTPFPMWVSKIAPVSRQRERETPRVAPPPKKASYKASSARQQSALRFIRRRQHGKSSPIKRGQRELLFLFLNTI